APQLRDGRGEDEQRHEGQVDEVGRLNQTNRDEERCEQPALRLGLPGDTRNQSVTRNTVTDTGADRAATHDQSTADESTGSDSGVHSVPPLFGGYLVAVYQVSVVMLVQLHGLAEVQDGQDREDEGLDRADEQVERLPDGVRRPHNPRG